MSTTTRTSLPTPAPPIRRKTSLKRSTNPILNAPTSLTQPLGLGAPSSALSSNAVAAAALPSSVVKPNPTQAQTQTPVQVSVPTPAPPQAQSQPQPRPQPGTIQSSAINHGADLLLELLENEKAALSVLYRNAMLKIEKDYKAAFTVAHNQVKEAQSKARAYEAHIEGLQAQLEQERSDTMDRENVLQGLKQENESLRSSIERARLHYVDGNLCFEGETARVVDDFIEGARKQEQALRAIGLSSALPALHADQLSDPVTPAQFFDVLSAVMARGHEAQQELRTELPTLLRGSSTDDPAGSKAGNISPKISTAMETSS
ncbi:hypothetical protein CPC08DRAFT_753083 [Agrocybe pediades]|nr:hypothetical protein CPC08DRAFT_753083 [Agrocybe pediades]